MTAQIANVDVTTDSFGQWITKTNQIITIISNTAVTTNSNTAVGNAAISGSFTANNVLASNGGFLRIGSSSSNVIANATNFLIRSSSSSNNLITVTGMVIDGTTQYSKTSMTIGNTTIMGANVRADSIILNNNFTLGNTILTTTAIQGQTANVEEINVVYDVSIGNNLANVYIDTSAVNVYYSSGAYSANSRMTANTLWIENIFANSISTTGNTTFQQSVAFLGANNYFANGITALGTSYLGNLIINSGVDITPDNVWAGQFRVLGNGYYGGVSLDATGMWVGHTSTARSLILATNETGRVYIDGTNGYVGVGNTAPAKPLTVSPGQIRLTGTTSGFVGLEANAVAGSTTFTLPAADGSARQYLGTDGSGKLGFYSVTGSDSIDLVARSIGVGAGVGASGVNGEIRAAGNITGYFSSDERLKENVKNIPNALNIIKNINGVEFDWTDEYIENAGGEDGYFVRKHDIGVIAQEVENVLPEVVGTRDDGFKAVKYERLVAVLIEAVKELSAEVDRLKNGN